MKKVLTSLLIVTSTVSFMACGNTKDTESKATSITVQVEKAWLPYYEAAKERVLKNNPDANIELVEVGSFDHLDIIDSTDSTNEDVTDLFAIPGDSHKLINNQALAAIDAKKIANEIGGFSNFEEGLSSKFEKDGEYFAFPYNIETLISYVNIENAKNSNIDISKNIEFTELNYENILALLHDGWFGVAFTNSINFDLLNKDKEGKFVSDATKTYEQLTPNEQKLFEALFNYWQKHDENKTDLWDKAAAGGYLDEKFKTGQTNAIKIDGPWAVTGIAENIGGEENLEVLPLSQITVNGEVLRHWKGGWGLAINSRIEEDETKMSLAIEMIKEIVNPEYAKDLFKYTGKILENVDTSAYEGIDALNKKVIDATYASYENAVGRSLFAEWDSVWPAWQNALLSWSATKPKNAEEAYKQIQASFNDMINSLNK